jgi:hypothetical protein
MKEIKIWIIFDSQVYFLMEQVKILFENNEMFENNS